MYYIKCKFIKDNQIYLFDTRIINLTIIFLFNKYLFTVSK